MESINRTRPVDAIQQQNALSALIGRNQESIATGKSFNRPSQAPSSWLEISSLGRQSTIEDSWLSNISRARILAQQAESTLDSLSNGVARARELMIQASNETLATSDREAIATELEGLREQFNQLTQARDSYGGQLFHVGEPIKMRVDTSILLVPSPDMDSVSQSIDIGGAVENLDAIMAGMIDAVRTGTAADRSLQLDRADSMTNHFSSLLASQGVMVNRLDQQEEKIQQSQLDKTERRSALEDTDISEAISRFQSLLVNLEAAQRLYAQSASTSLIRLIS